ncbi:hypothetical protein Btru_032068 [Bulinus truncatus]|nr:hypothetical protein Btru_032068 [Bulinus truncatus]
MTPPQKLICSAQVVLTLFVIPAVSQNMSVDDYCYLNLPFMRRQPKSKMAILSFIIICSNIDMYNQCLFSTREKSFIKGVTVQIFERQFPESYNIRRAGYLFCTEEVPKARYSFNEDDLVRCEQNVNRTQCRLELGEWTRLNRAIVNKDTDLVRTMSCNYTVRYYQCLREQYKKCRPDFDKLFIYFFSRVGPDCLLSQKEFNSLVLVMNCSATVASRNDGTTTQSHIESIMAGMLFPYSIIFRDITTSLKH